MIVAVTGSSGFIGSRLVEAMVWRGWTVRRLVRAGTAAAEHATRDDEHPWERTHPLGTRESHVVDLTDARALAGSPALADVDLVFHLAGVTKGRTEAEFHAGNVAPTRALLDALGMRAASGARVPRRVVYVSSQAAAGPALAADRPVTEDDAPRPFEAYGHSKLEAETLVRTHDAGLAWTIVRPAAVYGPGDTDFLALFRQAAKGLGVYPGARDARLSIAYVDDVVDALIRAGQVPAGARREFFVETESVTWRDVYKAVARAARAPMRVELDLPNWALALAGRAGDMLWSLTGRPSLVNSRKVALGTPRWWLCDGTRARDELGVVPRVSLTDGVTRTLAWYREHKWL